MVKTWAGRGRKPLWLQQAEEEGKTAEDSGFFRIHLNLEALRE